MSFLWNYFVNINLSGILPNSYIVEMVAKFSSAFLHIRKVSPVLVNFLKEQSQRHHPPKMVFP